MMGGGYDQFEFVGRVDGAVADFARAKGPEDKARSAAHAEGQGGGEGQKNFHGRGYGEGHALGSLQRERLGNQFARITCRLVIMANATPTAMHEHRGWRGGCFRSSFRTGAPKRVRPASRESGW